MRLLILCMLSALVAAACAKAPQWLLPKEGAVITGKAVLQTTNLGDIESRKVAYYLESASKPELPPPSAERKEVGGSGDPTIDLAEGSLELTRNPPEDFAFRLLPEAKQPGKYAVPPWSYSLQPRTPLEGHQGGYATYDDFTKPLTMDFSHFMPGRYRLVMAVPDEKNDSTIRVVRNIELRTNGQAPVVTIERIQVTPSGKLLVSGTCTDDSVRNWEAWRELEYENRLPYVHLAVDGKVIIGSYERTEPSFPSFPDTSKWDSEMVWRTEMHLLQPDLVPYELVGPPRLLTPGRHLISVLLTDPYGNEAIITQELTLPLTYLSLWVEQGDSEPAPYRPLFKGVPAVCTAVAVGGTSVEYAFQRREGAAWVTVRDWGPEPVWEWTPEAPGEYQIKVLAREGGKTIARETALRVAAPLTKVKLTGMPVQPIPAGSEHEIRAVSTGGAWVGYRFAVFDGKHWLDISRDVHHDRLTFYPPHPGTYQVNVRALPERETEESIATGVTVTVTAPLPLRGVTLRERIRQDNPPYPSPVPDSMQYPMTLEAIRMGGTRETVTYRFFASSDGQTWEALDGDLSDNTREIPPFRKQETHYRVTATENKTGKTFNAVLALPARTMQPTTGIILRSELSSPQPVNMPIQFTVVPDGDIPVTGTRVEVLIGDDWMPLDKHPHAEVFIWYPSEPGTYRLRATAQTLEWNDMGQFMKGQALTEEITFTIRGYESEGESMKRTIWIIAGVSLLLIVSLFIFGRISRSSERRR